MSAVLVTDTETPVIGCRGADVHTNTKRYCEAIQ